MPSCAEIDVTRLGQRRVLQIDREVADAELVVALQLGARDRVVLAFADAAADRHVDRGRRGSPRAAGSRRSGSSPCARPNHVDSTSTSPTTIKPTASTPASVKSTAPVESSSAAPPAPISKTLSVIGVRNGAAARAARRAAAGRSATPRSASTRSTSGGWREGAATGSSADGRRRRRWRRSRRPCRHPARRRRGRSRPVAWRSDGSRGGRPSSSSSRLRRKRIARPPPMRIVAHTTPPKWRIGRSAMIWPITTIAPIAEQHDADDVARAAVPDPVELRDRRRVLVARERDPADRVRRDAETARDDGHDHPEHAHDGHVDAERVGHAGRRRRRAPCPSLAAHEAPRRAARAGAAAGRRAVAGGGGAGRLGSGRSVHGSIVARAAGRTIGDNPEPALGARVGASG